LTRPAGPSGWGRSGRRAAIAVTFDNLGEAADLERGRWPGGEPLGAHFSVTRVLPRMLALLSELGLPATFFVEGFSAELYPEAVGAIVAAGHEVGLHGWRHEPWSDLDPERERELLVRGVSVLESLSLAPAGFRPPGGVLPAASWHALRATGFRYCSPAGEGVGVRAGLPVLPFQWSLLDAFHYLPDFAPRRLAHGAGADPLPPAALGARLAGELELAERSGGFLALLFHPFLLDDRDRFEVLRSVLTEVRRLVCAGAAWCAPLREIAGWVADQHGAGVWPLSLEG
jgi:peptidoglycan/xylan/chitin deacetylase (PgdA/CDA1 family)